MDVSPLDQLLIFVSGTDGIYQVVAFSASSLCVVDTDCMYAIANLLISIRFFKYEQGLTGGVFNTVGTV